MNRPFSFILFGSLVIFAAFGLIHSLVTNATQFLGSILIGAIVLLIVFFVFRRFSSHANPERKAFRKAARSTKKRYQTNQPSNNHKKRKHHPNPHGLTVISKEKCIHKPSEKSNIHLTVIDGKKSRKKNRALF